jgi:hypothetical protein
MDCVIKSRAHGAKLILIEFFCFLGIIVAFYIRWSLNNQLGQDFKKLRPDGEPTPPVVASPQRIPLNVVARSVYDLVGSYNGEQICRYVQLDDGRTFEFESLAVEKTPGVYHADDVEGVYIIVDKHLLYREVQVD